MNARTRILVVVAGAAGACAIAVPAALGFSDNPSFNQRIPVRVPQSAKIVHFDDKGRAVEKSDDSSSRAAKSASS